MNPDANVYVSGWTFIAVLAPELVIEIVTGRDTPCGTLEGFTDSVSFGTAAPLKITEL